MPTIKVSPERGFDVKFAPIAAVTAGAGSTDIVPAVAGKRIRVLNYTIVESAAGVNPKFTSGLVPTDLTGVLGFGANGGAAPQGTPLSPQFETGVGEKLSLAHAAAGTTGGHLTYMEV